MKITVSQLRRIIREEVERVTGSSLPFGGVINDETGELLGMVSISEIPPEYLPQIDMSEENREPVDDEVYDESIEKKVKVKKGYAPFLGKHEEFEELRRKLKGLPPGKPKKQWKAPFQINREKMGR